MAKKVLKTRVFSVQTRKVDAQTVWSLSQYVGNFRHMNGSYSSEVLAAQQAAKIIAKDAGLGSIRLPAWTTLSTGAKELMYGRDHLSWRFVMEPWIVDGDA